MEKLQSELFIDGGDPKETIEANELLKTKKPEWGIGIEGQTTNPTLVAKNPQIQAYLAQGKKLSQSEVLEEYKKIVQAIAQVTKGPISIQVIADGTTKKDDMIAQANVYREWIPNGVIKFPCTTEGLAAAEELSLEYPVNMTLNFSVSQAAAIYEATKKAKHRVFISPFVGRLDDIGQNGMQLIDQELHLYSGGDGHVEVLTASVRSIDHLLYAILLKSPAITIPFKVFKSWGEQGFPLPDQDFAYISSLAPLKQDAVVLGQDWRSYNLHHELTDKGLAKFMEDWQLLLK